MIIARFEMNMAFLCELVGILQQVDDDLLEATHIAKHLRQSIAQDLFTLLLDQLEKGEWISNSFGRFQTCLKATLDFNAFLRSLQGEDLAEHLHHFIWVKHLVVKREASNFERAQVK